MTGMKTGMTLLCSACILMLSASDQDANKLFTQGRAKEKDSSYRRAASRYMDAHFLAESSVLRGNLLIAAARANRKAQLYGEEFDCLERLIREHLSEIDFTKIIDREYAIGDLFFAGHRDQLLSWIPFIKEKDRTVEIYEAALKHAPCHRLAGETRLRLSRIYIDDQKTKEAIRHLREIPKLHPGSPSAKYAMLELCSLLYQMAERGDGDGSYSRQTIEACDNYMAAFPRSKETAWVLRTRQKALNGIAARFHAVGTYYYRSGKPELAEKYLAEVVKNYSNTESAADSEKLLAKIDEEFEAMPGRRKLYQPVKENVVRTPIPPEDEPIMVTPEFSGNRWLLPIRNLKKSPAVSTNTVTPDEMENFTAESNYLKKIEAKHTRKNYEAADKSDPVSMTAASGDRKP